MTVSPVLVFEVSHLSIATARLLLLLGGTSSPVKFSEIDSARSPTRVAIIGRS